MKPILFSTDMVRAILDGRKTETRRPIKNQNMLDDEGFIIAENITKAMWRKVYKELPPAFGMKYFAPYQVGDIIYVRETWGNWSYDDPESNAVYYQYRADYPDGAKTYMYDAEHECDLPKWHPSIHMPKEAARLFLKVTEVRVERLQDITEEGAMAEGVDWLDGACYENNGWTPTYYDPDSGGSPIFRDGFKALWDSVYGNWDANPWTWVICFERIEKPEVTL